MNFKSSALFMVSDAYFSGLLFFNKTLPLGLQIWRGWEYWICNSNYGCVSFSEWLWKEWEIRWWESPLKSPMEFSVPSAMPEAPTVGESSFSSADQVSEIPLPITSREMRYPVAGYASPPCCSSDAVVLASFQEGFSMGRMQHAVATLGRMQHVIQEANIHLKKQVTSIWYNDQMMLHPANMRWII